MWECGVSSLLHQVALCQQRVGVSLLLLSFKEHFRSPSRLTMEVLGSQLVECEVSGCNRVVRVDNYNAHLHSKCRE